VRISQLAIAEGGARTPAWRFVLLVGVCIDISTWTVLRRRGILGFKTRLAVDSIEVGIWSIATYDPANRYNLAVFLIAPLAIEVGLCRPSWAWTVPLATFVSTTAMRSLVGRPFVPGPCIWIVLAAGCGVILSRYDSVLQKEAARQALELRSAADRRAYLAGKNSVAMGASSVVDGIQGIVPLIGRPAADSALFELADGWKTELCAETRTVGRSLGAIYLDDAVKEWELRNNSHHDLSSLTRLTAAEGVGTILLTGTQPAELWTRLDALDMRGPHRVELTDPDTPQRPPGRPFRLQIGEYSVDVGADKRRPSYAIDPVAIAFVLMGLLALGDIVQMDVPLTMTVAAELLFLGAALFTHRAVKRLGSTARPMILLLASLVALTTALLFNATGRHEVSPSGQGLFSIVSQLDLLAIVAGMYRTTLKRRHLTLAIAAAGAVIASAWFLHSGPRHPGDVIVGLVWPMCALLSAWTFAPLLSGALDRHRDDLLTGETEVESAAFQRGRSAVLSLVRLALDDAVIGLRRAEPTLSPVIAALAWRQLSEVELRL
jgi:hypothetical protein